MRSQWMLRSALKAMLPFIFASAVMAADESGATAMDEVKSAFELLAKSKNYTISSTGSSGKNKDMELLSGKINRDGWTLLRLKGNDFVFKGKRGVVSAGDRWATIEELQSEEFRAKLPGELNYQLGRTVMAALASYKSPTDQALELSGQVGVYQKKNGRFTGDLKPEAVARLFDRYTTRYTFWVEIENGLPMKWGVQQEQVHPDTGGEKFLFDMVTKITAVGTTELNVPPAAKEKLK